MQEKKPISLAVLKEKKIMTAAKFQIMESTMKKKTIVGAKGSGKTIIPEVEAVLMMEIDPFFNAGGLRKFKDQASTKLAAYFHNTIALMKMYGIELKREYRKSQSQSYRLTSKFDMTKNQQFAYSSLDNPTATDGMSPTNGGYFGMLMIDEFVDKSDADNPNHVVKKDDWDEAIDIIEDNLERYNDNYNTIRKKNVTTKTYLLTNPWGNHPELDYVYEQIPQDEFIDWVFFGDNPEHYEWRDLLGDGKRIEELFDDITWVMEMMNRNTKIKEIPKDDRLVAILTKFANPNNFKPEKANKILGKIKRSLLTSNINALTITMGIKYQGKVDTDMLVYNLSANDIPSKTPEEFIADGYKAYQMTYSVDIDSSRVYTITPTYRWRKQVMMLGESAYWDEKILIGKQIELKANGLGEFGELITQYINSIGFAIEKHYKYLRTNLNQYPKKTTLALDDKRKQYLLAFKQKNLYFIDQYRIFKQHGENKQIADRQDLTIMGFKTKTLFNHPDNKKLVRDIESVTKAKLNAPERNTSGRINYLDRIDSMENGWIEWRMIIKRAARGYKK